MNILEKLEKFYYSLWKHLSYVYEDKRRTNIETKNYFNCEIVCNTGGLFLKKYYGYISKNDYDSFLNGNLEGSLKVLDYYSDDQSFIINKKSIISLNVIE